MSISVSISDIWLNIFEKGGIVGRNGCVRDVYVLAVLRSRFISQNSPSVVGCVCNVRRISITFDSVD